MTATIPAPELRSDAARVRAAAAARLEWVDVCKGIGIFLVVVGHTLRGLVGARVLAADGAAATVDRVVYSFHMALFFFLSGLFLLPRGAVHFPDAVRRAAQRLAWPYVVWAPLQSLLQVLMAGHTNSPGRLSWSLLWDPPMQFWFLHVLLLHALVFAALAALGTSRRMLVVVALAVWASAGHVPLGPWGVLHQARATLFFTALGIAAGPTAMLAAIGTLPRAWLLAAAAACWAAVAMMLAGAPAGWPEASAPAAFVALVGSVGTALVAVWIAGAAAGPWAWLRRQLAWWGSGSLAIFVAHTMASSAARIGLQRVAGVSDPAVHVVAGIAAGILLPLALLALVRRFAIPFVFAWPDARAGRAGRAARAAG